MFPIRKHTMLLDHFVHFVRQLQAKSFLTDQDLTVQYFKCPQLTIQAGVPSWLPAGVNQ